MADRDYTNDASPVQAFKKPVPITVTALKSALTTYSSTSYTPARLQSMTKNDMLFAARSHGLTVTGAL